MRFRVIGVGTPHGDDAAGLLAADLLAGLCRSPDTAIVTCSRPALDLLDALADADAALVLDAMRSGAAPRSVRLLAPAEAVSHAPTSSHGLGLAEALELGRALGRLPPRLSILGIEIGAAPLRGGPSPGVRSAAARAAHQALSLLRDWRREAAGSDFTPGSHGDRAGH